MSYRVDGRQAKIVPAVFPSYFGSRRLVGPSGEEWFTNGSSGWAASILAPASLQVANDKLRGGDKDSVPVDVFWPRSPRLRFEYMDTLGGVDIFLTRDKKVVRFVDSFTRPPRYLWGSVALTRDPLGAEVGSPDDRRFGHLRPSESDKNDLLVSHPDPEKATFFTSPVMPTNEQTTQQLLEIAGLVVPEFTEEEQTGGGGGSGGYRGPGPTGEYTFTVRTDSLHGLEKRIAALGKKAARYGLKPPVMEVLNDVNIPITNGGERTPYSLDGKRVRLSLDATIQMEGEFEVLAVVKRITDGVNMVIGKTADDAKLDPKLWTTDMRCDHCNKTRRRNSVVVVEDRESGERKQVGRACVDDYTGHPGLGAIIAMVETLSVDVEALSKKNMDEEEFESYGDLDPRDMKIPLRAIVGFGLVAVREEGKYVSVNSDTGLPTKDAVVSMLFPPKNGDTTKWVKLSVSDYAEADRIIAWAKELSPVSDFDRNIQAVAGLRDVPYNVIGLGVAMIPGYNRSMARQLKVEQTKKLRDEMGTAGIAPYRDENIGDKITFTGALNFRTSFDTAYGTTHLLKFGDEAGRNIVWRASSFPTVKVPKGYEGTEAHTIDSLRSMAKDEGGTVSFAADLPTEELRQRYDAKRNTWATPTAEMNEADLRYWAQYNVRDEVPVEDFISRFVVGVPEGTLPAGVKHVIERARQSTAGASPEIGVTYKVTGKIKRKGEYNGEPQTEISHAKIERVVNAPVKASTRSVEDQIYDLLERDNGLSVSAALLLENAHAKITAGGDRDEACIVSIPVPASLAKRFPGIEYNKGHEPHLTVCFISADLDAGQVSSVAAAVRRIAKAIPHFQMRADVTAGLQDFGDHDSGEKALWLAADSHPAGLLGYLHRAIRQAVESAGIEVQSHPTFKGHITWRYVPNDIAADKRSQMGAAAAALFPTGLGFPVSSVVVTNPFGRPYTVGLSPKARMPTIFGVSAASVSASSKSQRNDVLTRLYWAGKKGKELDTDGITEALADLEEDKLVRKIKNGWKLTSEGEAAFAKISPKKADLVDKGVRKHNG